MIPQGFLFQFLLYILCFTFISGCQRSPEFRKEVLHGNIGSSPYSAIPPSSSDLETATQPKKKVFIFDFLNDTPVKDTSLGAFAADELKRGLYLTKRVLIPADLRTQLTTADFVEDERVRVAQLLREGRKLGVSVLAIGRIKKIVLRQSGNDVGLFREKQSSVVVDLEMKLFDVETSRELLSTGSAGEALTHHVLSVHASAAEAVQFRTELIQSAMKEAVSRFLYDVIQAMEKEPWQGRIAKVLGKKFYINSGKESGLMKGDILRVFTAGDDVYDPASGVSLGRTKGYLKGTLEVTEYMGNDSAIGEMHTGANFKEGDLLELY